MAGGRQSGISCVPCSSELVTTRQRPSLSEVCGAGLTPVQPEGGYFVCADASVLFERAGIDPDKEASSLVPGWGGLGWGTPRASRTEGELGWAS